MMAAISEKSPNGRTMAAAPEIDTIQAIAGAASARGKSAGAYPLRAAVSTDAGTCHITMHDRFDTVAAAWLGLESSGALMTPYQRLDFMRAWHNTLGRDEGINLRIVEGRTEDGRTAFIWPLGCCSCRGFPMLGWLGGKHANYGMGIYDRHALNILKPQDWRKLMSEAGRLSGADAVVLLNQPESFEGATNPLAAIGGFASPSPCHAINLSEDYNALMERLRSRSSRKKIRRNIRRLEETAGRVELRRADTHVEIIEALAALRGHKQQLDNCRADRRIFSSDAVIGFLTQAAIPHEDGPPPPLEIHALHAGERIVATFVCAVSQTRAAGTSISFDSDEFAQCAPGEVMIAMLLEHFCARGIKTFDLGVGDAEYKRRWCHDKEPLFDSVIASNLRGRILTAPSATLSLKIKAVLKHSPRLLGLLHSIQGRLS